MSQKPGAEALGESTCNLRSQASYWKLSQMHAAALQHNLPPATNAPSKMLDGIAPLEMPSEEFSPILIAFLEEKMYQLCNIYCSVQLEKEPYIIL